MSDQHPGLPEYPPAGLMGKAMPMPGTDTKSDSAPTGVPGQPNPPQGQHGAAGGLPVHRGPDGGMGMGNRAPHGWPKEYQE